MPGMDNLPEHLRGLALPAHLALQDAEKSNDLRKKLEARKAMTASVTQVSKRAAGCRMSGGRSARGAFLAAPR